MASRKKFNSRQECEEFIDTLSYPHIKSWLADFLMEPAPETAAKIVVTEEQMASLMEMFKVRGIASDGTVERRGRKPKAQ